MWQVPVHRSVTELTRLRVISSWVQVPGWVLGGDDNPIVKPLLKSNSFALFSAQMVSQEACGHKDTCPCCWQRVQSPLLLITPPLGRRNKLGRPPPTSLMRSWVARLEEHRDGRRVMADGAQCLQTTQGLRGWFISFISS